jgi:hypothetical protein
MVGKGRVGKSIPVLNFKWSMKPKENNSRKRQLDRDLRNRSFEFST